MSLRSQSDRLATQGAKFRRELMAIPFTWSGLPGKTFCGVFTGISTGREIEAGGFELQPDATVRVQISLYPGFTPALGQTLVVDETTLMIVRINTPLAGSDELVVGLGKP